MQIGEKYWHLVSTDSPGVPHGGRWGNVRGFEQAARKHGLFIGWSLIRHCFVLFNRVKGRWIDQFVFQKGSDPIPLSLPLLGCLLYAQRRFMGESKATLRERLANLQRKASDRQKEFRRQEAYERAREAYAQVASAQGWRRVIPAGRVN